MTSHAWTLVFFHPRGHSNTLLLPPTLGSPTSADRTTQTDILAAHTFASRILRMPISPHQPLIWFRFRHELWYWCSLAQSHNNLALQNGPKIYYKLMEANLEIRRGLIAHFSNTHQRRKEVHGNELRPSPFSHACSRSMPTTTELMNVYALTMASQHFLKHEIEYKWACSSCPRAAYPIVSKDPWSFGRPMAEMKISLFYNYVCNELQKNQRLGFGSMETQGFVL